MRKIKNSIKQLIEFINSLLSCINLLIVPIHYYTPIKNIKNIQKNKFNSKLIGGYIGIYVKCFFSQYKTCKIKDAKRAYLINT